MVYEFKIPFKEIGIKSAEELKRPVEIDFAVYGTVVAGDYVPAISYNPATNQYLLVYSSLNELTYI